MTPTRASELVLTHDQDGYPTDEMLASIRGFVIERVEDAAWLLDAIAPHWWHPEMFRRTKRPFRAWRGGPLRHRWTVSTGGWSGNESIISALEENHMFWAVAWVQSRRGGHYIFEAKR